MRVFHFVFFIPLVCFLACKGGADKKTSTQTEVSEYTDTIVSFSFDDAPAFDTISYNNIIESVRYIPLDTVTEAYVSSFPDIVYVRKIKGKYVICNLERGKKSAKLFDSDGSFITDMFKLGRGPEELLDPVLYVANDSTGIVTFVEFHNHVLCYDVENQSKKRYNIPRTKEPDEILIQWASFDDGSFAATKIYPRDERYNDNLLPYLYLIDNNLKTKTQLFYSEKRQLAQTVVPEVTDFPYEEWLLSQTCKGTEFIDMYNDTVFRLEPDLSKTPLYVIERGERYRPEYSDNKKQGQKKDKYYFYGFMDSPGFFVVKYYHDNERRLSVWNNKTGSRIMDVQMEFGNIFRPCSLPFSFDGFEGWLPIEYVTKDNRIYVVAHPMFFEKAPSHNDKEANSLLIEIKLKDTF